MKSLLRLSKSLFEDMKRLHPDAYGLDRDLQTIEARFEDEGYGFFAVALPNFGKVFDQALASERMSNVAGFASDGAIPKFLQGMLRHVFDAKTGTLLSEPSVECINSIRQVCYLFKKFLPESDRAEKLHKAAVRDFESVDREIADIDSLRLKRFADVCTFSLLELEFAQEHRCKHGPGAVLEGYSPNQKWRNVYQSLLDFDSRLIETGYDLQASLMSEDLPSDSPLPNDFVVPSGRLVTVPKSCSALRTITVEPCINQFIQQGLNATLRDAIKRDPIACRSLTLDSQEPNQVLAIEGSQTGDWCTIDLSAASDRLSLQTVEAAFASKPRFLKALKMSRTPTVEIDGNIIHLKKYAGMGNATTFPVQSYVFAMLAITAITSKDKYLTNGRLVRAARRVRVFGDDIIVRKSDYQDVVDWITSFGLKINRTKTFSEGNFRESCGVDAYRGVDITPVYLRYDPALISSDPSAFVSIVSTSNQLWLKCYYKASECLKQLADSLKKLPLVEQCSEGLGWHTRQNAWQFQRWNCQLHRFEVRTYVPAVSKRKDILDGYPALMKFFHSPRIAEFDPEHLSVSPRRFTLKLQRRWVRA